MTILRALSTIMGIFTIPAVPLWQFILSQVFGVFRLVLVVVGLLIYKKKITMSFILIGVFLSILSNILLLNWIAVALGSTVFFRFLAFILLEKGQEKTALAKPASQATQAKKPSKGVSLFVLILFLVIQTITVTLVFALVTRFWFEWLFLAGNLVATYGAWRKGPHFLRITKIQLSLLIIVNAVIFSNFMNIAIEVFSIITIGVFYLKLLKKQGAQRAPEPRPKPQLKKEEEIKKPIILENEFF